jgi:hypothetical protein
MKRMSKIDAYSATLRRDKQRDAEVIAAIERSGEAPAAAAIEQLRRYAQVRLRYMKEVPLLRSSDVAEISGSQARNGSARASRWKLEQRIFSVPWNGVDYYPAFQFARTDGQPLPAIKTILDIFGGQLTPWQTALWFWGGNGWLHDKSPMEMIQRDPQAVIEAAKHEMEPLLG